MFLELLSDPNVWLTLLTLSALEIVLGIDNLVMIAILVARLDPDQQPLARKLGLSLAMITRILLLATMSTLTKLTHPWFVVPYLNFACSGRDLVLILGGAFPSQHWIHLVGITSLWAAAALTLVTGYDYLRVGLKHMD